MGGMGVWTCVSVCVCMCSRTIHCMHVILNTSTFCFLYFEEQSQYSRYVRGRECISLLCVSGWRSCWR